MRFGVRLGLDPGDARIGVAKCDPSGIIATPLETVRRGKGDVARLAALAEEEGAIEVVVGLPRSLSGSEGRPRRRCVSSPLSWPAGSRRPPYDSWTNG